MGCLPMFPVAPALPCLANPAIHGVVSTIRALIRIVWINLWPRQSDPKGLTSWTWRKLAERSTSFQTSKCPENLRKASLYHVDAGHNHRIVFALVVFHFLTKQGMRGGRLFALCLGIEFLNLEANHFGKIVSLACMQHNAAFCQGKFWNSVCGWSNAFRKNWTWSWGRATLQDFETQERPFFELFSSADSSVLCASGALIVSGLSLQRTSKIDSQIQCSPSILRIWRWRRPVRDWFTS